MSCNVASTIRCLYKSCEIITTFIVLIFVATPKLMMNCSFSTFKYVDVNWFDRLGVILPYFVLAKDDHIV